MPKYMTCIPAYGRDYKSAAAVKADWAAKKDFIIQTMGPDDGKAINIDDSKEGEVFNIRYKRMTQVCVIKGGQPKAVKPSFGAC